MSRSRSLKARENRGPRPKPKPFYKDIWWPLEVAIVWVATGDPDLCQCIADLVAGRRAGPGPDGRYQPHGFMKTPSLAKRLMVVQGKSKSCEATPGAIYRRGIRARGAYPLETAIMETAEIIRGRALTSTTRALRLAKGKRADIAEHGPAFIPAAEWGSSKIVDDRKRGAILCAPGRSGKCWSHIDVHSGPFKALGIDRGTQALAQREAPPPGVPSKKNARIEQKQTKHEIDMGRLARKLRGRPKGSKDVH